MGGWANGIAAKELGTHLPGPMIWIGYRDSARYGLTTTLSLKDGAQQIWVEMDAATWRELIAEAEQAIHELWTASIDPEDIERFWSKVAVTDDPDACCWKHVD